jgi:solute carrier family 25 carnitine/acylcarnitine transporter 20/29
MNTDNIFNYLKGGVSGICGVILSHPLDTIKVHKQLNTNKPFNYSLTNLYKGIKAPLCGVGLEKSIVFGTYTYCKNQNLNTPLSGVISGLLASLIVSPYERIKILQQTNQSIKTVNINFLFKGLSATFTREVPGFAIYFSTYEKLKNTYIQKYNTLFLPLPCSFLFGGMSGGLAWIFIYPQDRIKTIMQSNKNKTNFVEVFSELYNKGGIRYLYSGFSFAMGRALLLHSGTFCMMEYLNRHI